MTAQQAASRLVPDKAALLVAGCRMRTQIDPAHALGWIAHVDWFAAADSIGMHHTRAARTAEKFAQMGLQDARNNYDGWLSPLGLETAQLIDPSIT